MRWLFGDSVALKLQHGWAGWLNAQLLEQRQVCCTGQQALKSLSEQRKSEYFL